jgi:hypothetical protein
MGPSSRRQAPLSLLVLALTPQALALLLHIPLAGHGGA